MVIHNILLADAVRKSQSMSDSAFTWSVYQNIVNAEIPPGYEFRSINILWRTTYSFMVTIEIRSIRKISCTSVIEFGNGNSWFHSIDELREIAPELLEATGEFRTC